jgi:hypothetical protein
MVKARLRIRLFAAVALCAALGGSAIVPRRATAGGIPPTPRPATTTDARIVAIARAYFADLVAGRYRASYDLLAPCSVTMRLSQGTLGFSQGTLGFSGRGVYDPRSFAFPRGLSAAIAWVRVAQDATLRRYGLREALVEGTFRFRWPPYANDTRPDGRHVIAGCGGRWRLYAPWGGGGPYGWT